MPENYDVVIVGAGPGGSVLAARLAERGVNPRNGEKLRIALMDMGPYSKGEPRPGYGIPLRRQAYVNIPDRDDILAMGSTPWGTCSGIGGQQLHWGGLTIIPSEEDHEDWVRETGVDWTYDKLTDARKEAIEMYGISEDPDEVAAPGSLKFRDVATKMGYQVLKGKRPAVNCIGCGYCTTRGCKYDSKSDPLVRYIPIAEKHGVEIMPLTMVEKVIIEKKGAAAVAKGVVYTRNGKTEQANADYVIVSGGPGTPRLLFKSGYGPRDKVPNLIVENPNLGKINSIHPLKNVYAVFDEPVRNPDFGSAFGRYYFWGRGAQGYTNLLIGDLFSFSVGSTASLTGMALNAVAPDFGRAHKEFMKKPLHFGCLRSGVERVRDASGKLITDPQHPEVVKRMREAREIANEVLLKMGAKRTDLKSGTGAEPMAGGDSASPPDVGSGISRAGSDRSNSVINSDFECHDVENLFICDGGVFPSMPGVFGQGGSTIVMLACHAWRRIVAKHFSRA